MSVNLIKRKVKVQKIPRSYNEIERFYVVWHRDNEEYFLSDANSDGSAITWHKNKTKGVSFKDGKEALSFCKAIKERRSGPGIIELKVVTEKVRADDELGWMI